MAYDDLTGTELLNGAPKDQTIFTKMISNQDEIKDTTDNLPSLSSLGVSIIPSVTDSIGLGSEFLHFLSIWGKNFHGEILRLNKGRSSNLSFAFDGDLTTGFYSSNAGSIDFITNGYNILHLDSSSALLSSSNDAQLFFANATDGSRFSIGIINDEMFFKERKISPDNIFKLTKNLSEFYVDLTLNEKLNIKTFSFEDNLNILYLKHLTKDILSISEDLLLINSSVHLDRIDKADFHLNRRKEEASLDTNIKTGDEIGEIIFSGSVDNLKNLDTGVLITAKAESDFSGTNQKSSLSFKMKKQDSNIFEDILTLGKKDSPELLCRQSFGMTKQLLETAGTYTQYDLGNKSVLKVDTSNGDIILDTLEGGMDCQFLFIFKSEPQNNLTIKHNSISSGQKIMTQNQSDFILGSGYGGVTLVCDEGIWKEISIS